MTAGQNDQAVENVPVQMDEETASLVEEYRRRQRNAYQRLIEAMEIIDGMPFAKDLKNSQFSSVPIDDMRNAVRKACVKAGLVHILQNIEYEVTQRGTTTYYSGSGVMRFVNVDAPGDWIDFPTLACASNNGDKIASLFETNLIKNAYKAIFDIGEAGKDDIDAYSNEDVVAEAERIAERRARRQEAAAKDPFFGKGPSKEVVALRKQIGQLYAQGGKAASVVDRYKAEHGSFASWPEETLRACLDEAGKEGSE